MTHAKGLIWRSSSAAVGVEAARFGPVKEGSMPKTG